MLKGVWIETKEGIYLHSHDNWASRNGGAMVVGKHGTGMKWVTRYDSGEARLFISGIGTTLRGGGFMFSAGGANF
ncbi:DUF2974 domain-containing protein [Sesbania bispinosa]|nr:DUF2974 domain-containing protein [Sesbania bispinosa]